MLDSSATHGEGQRSTLAGPAADCHVARSALLVASLFAADKILALFRDVIISRAFGASPELDAYYAAFELPDGLFTIIAGSAMATTLIPVLSAVVGDEGRQAAWRLVSAVVNIALLLVVGVGSVAALFAPQVIAVVAPGFDPDQRTLAATLMRLVLIQTLLFTLSGILMGALRTYRHFLFPALAPLVYTLSRIVATLLLAPRWGIFGLAWGGIVGALLYLLVLTPALLRYGARWWPILHHPRLGTVLTLMGPRTLGLGVTYLTFVVPTFLGSRLADGAISAYEYSWRLMQFAETIIGTALGITIFPTLASLAHVGRRDDLRRQTSWALRLILALAIPAGVGLLLLGRPLTALFFQRGAFDAEATDRVAFSLRFFALGLVTHSALEVASRLFFAQRDMWTPLYAATVGFLVNLLLGWVLLPILAHGAIALSNSIGAGLQVVLLLAVSRRRLGSLQGAQLWSSLARTVAASLIMGGAILGFQAIWPDAGLLTEAVGGVVVGGGVYLLAAVLLRSDEIRELPRLMLARRSGLPD